MKKAFEFIQKNMFYLVIIIVGLAYILTGMSSISESEETIGSIIATGGLSTILGWIISALFGQQAIIDGFEDEDLINAMNVLGTEIKTIEPDIDKLDIYCDKQNEDDMIRKRTRLLKRVGLDVDLLEHFNRKKLKGLTKRQKKAVKKSLKIGFGYLSSDWLLSDIEEKEEKDNKPVSVNTYTMKKNISNLFTKIFLGIISGMYILEPFANANWNVVIWRLFFFATWLIFGYLRYAADFNFITKNYRKTVIKKKNEIISFRISLTEKKHWYHEPVKEVVLKQEQTLINENKDKPLTEATSDTKANLNPYYKNEPLGV